MPTRRVLLAGAPVTVTACLRCGAIVAFTVESSEPSHPRAEPEIGGYPRVPLDEATARWLSESPRVVAGSVEPAWLPAALRVESEAALVVAERDATRSQLALPLLERLRAAGVVAPPLAGALEPYATLARIPSLTEPKALLALTAQGQATIARAASEQLAHTADVPSLIERALAGGDTRAALAALAYCGRFPRAALAGPLAARLAVHAEQGFLDETEIEPLVFALVRLGPAAAPARSALAQLGFSDLARRRSTLRDLAGSALAAIANG